MRLLLVEDDRMIGETVQDVLRSEHYTVEWVQDGLTAESALKTKDYDLILLDIMMPEMDGYDTMRAIRRIPKFKSLPIITLTAKAMKGDRDKCIAAGASDYITKPVDVAQLLSMMRVWLH